MANPTSKMIMAVDDSAEVLAILNGIIAQQGYRFVCARIAEQCLRLIQESRPDLIFLDINMPEMDGFELCRRIRSMPENAKTPIAFLTSRNTTEDVKAALDAGGNDYIAKPFDAKTIRSRVNRWL